MNGQKNLIRRNKPIKPYITTNWCISNVFSVEFQANEYNDAQLLLQLPKDYPWLINITSRFWSITFIFRFYDVKRPTKKGMKKCPYLLLRKSGTARWQVLWQVYCSGIIKTPSYIVDRWKWSIHHLKTYFSFLTSSKICFGVTDSLHQNTWP